MHGKVRLANVLEYRKPSPNKPWQTDPYEDVGIEVHNGVSCETTSLTPPFVWCSATIEANSDRLLDVDPGYDTIVTVVNPIVLFQKIREALCSLASWAWLMAGYVFHELPAFSQGRRTMPVFQGCAYADLTIGPSSALLIVEKVR